MGQIADKQARDALKIALAPGGRFSDLSDAVLVNRRMYNVSGTNFTIPDIRIPSEGIIIDGTIGYKDNKTPQVIKFFEPPTTKAVIIVTPNTPQAVLRSKGKN